MQVSEREGLPDVPSGTVTFLFTDIEGSTRLLEQLREGYAAVLSDQRVLLRAAFAHCNGHEIDTQGDAFFAAFPRALDALNCVIEAQQALVAHHWPQDVQVRVRMGLHTGEPIVARTGYVGMDVHRAARIAAAGHGGQVLLSQTTRDLIYQDLPSGTTLRALGEHKLRDIRFAQPLYQLDIAGLPSDFAQLTTLSSGEEPPTPGEAPFKGLQYFDEADADWFFGRDQVTGRLAARVCGERFLAVIGASGSGKSSLVRAGLVPALKRGGRLRDGTAQPCPDVAWQIFVLTPTAHPLETLATSLTRAGGSMAATAGLIDDLRGDARSLHLHVHERLHLDRRGARAAGQERVLLVVDQFEELFTLCHDAAERLAFVNSLLTAASAEGGGTSVVLTLRADFYEHLAAYPGLSAAVAHHQEYLGAMNSEELRQAIEAPAARGGWEFSPGLVDLLLHDIGASEGRPPEPGALPLLSHALLETWQHRRGNLLNLRAYTESGGVRGAIAHTAEGVFQQELTPAQQTIARNIFLRLTELGEGTQDTRRRVSYQELFPGAQGTEVEEVLADLADARLITTAEGTVEVAHEALIREWPTLRQWLDEDREGLRLHRHLTEAAQAWAAFNRDLNELYRGTRLGQAREWATAHPGQLNALEQEFLDASRAQAERDEAEREAARQRELETAQQLAEAQHQRAETLTRAARQLRRWGVYLLGALVVALAAALWANTQRLAAVAAQQQAIDNLAVSDAQRLAADSKTLILEGRDAPTAALLALRSIQLRYTPQGDEVLSSAEQLDYPLRMYTGHVAQLWGGEFLPGNKVIVTSSSDNQATVRLWDVATGKELRAFDVQGGCLDATVAPDGHLLAASCWDGFVHLWNLDSGQEVRRLKLTATDNPRVRFSPDGKQLLTGGSGAPALLWDIASGSVIRQFAPADSKVPGIAGVAFLPNGQQIVTGGQDGVVRLWDVASGAQIRAYAGHTDTAWGIAVSPDGQYALSSSLDGTGRLWELATGREVHRFVQPGGMSYVAAFSPDGRYALTGGWDNTVRVWNVETGLEVRRFTHPRAATGLAFSSDGRYVLTTAWDQVARLWELRPSAGLPRYAGLEPSPADYGVLSPDGRTLAVTSVDYVVRLSDARTGQELRRLAGHQGDVWGAAFSPDGRYLATASFDNTTRVWDTQSGGLLLTIPFTGSEDVAFSPDGQKLVIAGTTTAGLFELATGQRVQSFPYADITYYAAYAPDGVTVVTSSSMREDVLLWDAATGHMLRTFHPDQGDVMRALAYSPDGKYLATAGNTGTLYLWDLATGQEVRRFVGHTNTVERALAFSPDGRYLASGSFDRTVRIRDVASGREIRRLDGYTDGVTGVDFTPDGKQLLSISADGSVHMSYVSLQDAVDDLCGRQLHDFSTDERQLYSLPENSPTCPKFAAP